MKQASGLHGKRAAVALIAASLLAVAGCASIMGRGAIDTERTLAAAGFQMKLADTPEKLAHLQTLAPQRKLVPHSQDGEMRYVWADAKYCKCLYAGSELAYQRYQKLAIQQKLADEQRDAALANEDAAMNWGMYGGWGPWW
jgi:hypothetical protein